MVEGGECFARRHDRDLREGLSVPLQLQLIEAEQLPFYLARPTPNTPQGNVVRASIEFDPSGRRTAYYFYKQHPGERIFFPTDLELMRVPAAEVNRLLRQSHNFHPCRLLRDSLQDRPRNSHLGQ
jgi:capsid protein